MTTKRTQIRPRRDRRISIEYQQVTVEQAFGTDEISWVRLNDTPMWAEFIDSLPGRDEATLQGELSVFRQTARIRIGYRTDIDSSMRVILHGDSDTIYSIIGGPTMIGRREWLEILCERQKP